MLWWKWWGDGRLYEGEYCDNHSNSQKRFSFCCLVQNGLDETGSGVMGFPSCISIKSLEVYWWSGWTILLCTDVHPVTPCYRFSYGIRFIHSKLHVPVKSRLNFFLQMHWYLYRCIVWWAISVALGSIIRHRGFVFIIGSDWWLQVLNVLEA